jgi:hypothetical protein
LFLLPELAEHTTAVKIDLKKLLFFRNLKAEVQLADGTVLGRRPSLA